MFNVHNRSYLTLMEYTPRQIHFLLDLSRDLKRAKYAGNESQRLSGKNIALIFEKTSTRTRCAFEVAAHDQGAHVTYLDSSGSQIGQSNAEVPANGVYIAQVTIPPGASYGDITISQ